MFLVVWLLTTTHSRMPAAIVLCHLTGTIVPAITCTQEGEGCIRLLPPSAGMVLCKATQPQVSLAVGQPADHDGSPGGCFRCSFQQQELQPVQCVEGSLLHPRAWAFAVRCGTWQITSSSKISREHRGDARTLTCLQSCSQPHADQAQTVWLAKNHSVLHICTTGGALSTITLASS